MLLLIKQHEIDKSIRAPCLSGEFKVQFLIHSICFAKHFARSEVHSSTSINGKRQKDPLGEHVTLCYKDQSQLDKQVHIAAHGYVTDAKTLGFKFATHRGEKSDLTVKNIKGGVVWPSNDQLWEAPDIGYSHIDEPATKT